MGRLKSIPEDLELDCFSLRKRFPLSLLVLVAGLGLLGPVPETLGNENVDPLEEKSVFELSLEELGNIQVTIATTDSVSIMEAPSVVTVISREEIRSQNPRHLSDLLNLVPGFNIVIEGLHAPLIQLRGTGNRQDHILLMIDGHRLNSQLFGGITYIINDIPVEIIDHIEIIRGPGSAVYGSNAFEAVINIVTVSEQAEYGNTIYGKFGTQDTKNLGVVYKGRNAAYDLVLAASGLESHGPRYDYVDRSAFAGQTSFPQQITNLYVNFQSDHWGLKTLYNEEETGPFIGLARYLNQETVRQYTTMFAEGSYRRCLGEKGSLKARFYFDSFDYDCDWMLIPPRLYQPDGFVQLATATDSRLGGEAVLKTIAWDRHRIMVGASYDHIELDNSTLAQTDSIGLSTTVADVPGGWIDEDKNYHYSFYAQDHVALLEELKLTAGLRYDNYDKYGDSLNPRVGLTGHLHNSSYVKLLYGSAFRAPTYYESNTRMEGGLVPNSDIRPEKLQTLEAEYFLNKDRLTARTNAYYTHIKDLMGTVAVPGGYTKTNLYSLDSYGVEGELKYSWRRNRSFALSGFWNYSDDDNGHRILRIPNYGAALVLDGNWNDSFDTNLQLKYVGKMKKDPLYDHTGLLVREFDPIPESFTVNLAVSYRVGDLTFKGSIHNIFDEPLVSPAPSSLNANDDPEADYPYQRRFAMFGLELGF